MKRRTEGMAVAGLVVLAAVAWVVMLIVFIVVGRAMFHAADDGDTAKTIAYGVVLLILVLSSAGSRSRK